MKSIHFFFLFFFSKDGLIVFAELFQVAMGWEIGVSICKAIGIKLDKPKGKGIGELGSIAWVYEVLSKALWKINGQSTWSLKKKNNLTLILNILKLVSKQLATHK